MKYRKYLAAAVLVCISLCISSSAVSKKQLIKKTGKVTIEEKVGLEGNMQARIERIREIKRAQLREAKLVNNKYKILKPFSKIKLPDKTLALAFLCRENYRYSPDGEGSYCETVIKQTKEYGFSGKKATKGWSCELDPSFVLEAENACPEGTTPHVESEVYYVCHSDNSIDPSTARCMEGFHIDFPPNETPYPEIGFRWTDEYWPYDFTCKSDTSMPAQGPCLGGAEATHIVSGGMDDNDYSIYCCLVLENVE